MAIKRLLILLLVFVAIAVEGYGLVRTYAVNAGIREGSIAVLEHSARPEAEFAQAYYLAREGKTEEALGLYQRVQKTASPELSVAAQYNAANVLLRRAIETGKIESGERAQPLFEMAKETYRAVLRRDPGYWDAKYNLERALRLSPEHVEGEAVGQNAGAERSVTTMRGFTLGLP